MAGPKDSMPSIFDLSGAEASEPMPQDEAAEEDGMEDTADEMIAAINTGNTAALASVLRSLKAGL